MIQRKQTLFLILTIICLVLMVLFPLVNFYGDYSYILKLFSFEDMSKTATAPFSVLYNLPLIALWTLILVFSLISIFLFKKRTVQMKLISVSILLTLIFIVLIFVLYTPRIEQQFNVQAEYVKCISLYLLLPTITFLFLAYRGVKKDDKLIKSIDRLR